MRSDQIFFRLFSRIAEEETALALESVGPLSKQFSQKPGSETLVVLVPGWYGTIEQHWAVRRMILKRTSLLEYEWSPLTLSTDCDSTLRGFRDIAEEMREDIRRLCSNGIKRCVLMTFSTGAVPTMMAARDNPNVNGLVLIAPGHDIAESLWGGIRTQHMRASFEERGITVEELVRRWHNLAPQNNLSGLENQEVRVVLARYDLFIPYRCGRKLVEAMHHRNLRPEVHELPLGHVVTGLFQYLWGQAINGLI